MQCAKAAHGIAADERILAIRRKRESPSGIIDKFLADIVLVMTAGLRLIQIEAVVAVRHKEINVVAVSKVTERCICEPIRSQPL